MTLLASALFAPAAQASKSTTTTLKPSIECTASQLSYSGPQAVSEQLGEDGFTITLTNVSTHLCQIHGYPTVRFYTSAGRLLTFGYSHSSQYFRIACTASSSTSRREATLISWWPSIAATSGTATSRRSSI